MIPITVFRAGPAARSPITSITVTLTHQQFAELRALCGQCTWESRMGDLADALERVMVSEDIQRRYVANDLDIPAIHFSDTE